MTALTADRNTPIQDGINFEYGVGAGSKIFAGAIVMKNATGFAVKGATATGQIALGVAQAPADNSAGADGAINVKVKKGTFRFANDGTITIADLEGTAYIVDDQTVADNNGTSTRSALGTIKGVDSTGVWVKIV